MGGDMQLRELLRQRGAETIDYPAAPAEQHGRYFRELFRSWTPIAPTR